MQTSDPVVVVDNVVKTHQRGRIATTVLRGVNLAVPPGEFFALTGPSGSGKTTLLNLIAGIDRPTSGRIVVGGTDLTPLSEDALGRWRRGHVGFVFQFYNLLPVLTAEENVEMPLLLTHLGRKERQEHVGAVLKLVGLEDRARHYPAELSGGQQQRVAIARALVSDPTLILADEPTGDLDAEAAEDVLDLMCRLNEQYGKTVVIVTHDARAAERATTRVVLDKGVLNGRAASDVSHATKGIA
jgi:putative ABC transport system ATP-binding protein